MLEGSKPMEVKERKKVLIVSPDRELGLLHSLFFDSSRYISRLCTFEDGPFAAAISFQPCLILILLDGRKKVRFDANALEFLTRIHQSYEEDERPLSLLIVPRDWADPQLGALVDEITISPVDPRHLMQRIEYLLQEYHDK